MVVRFVCAFALYCVHASGEHSSPVGSDFQIEEESSGNSLCLLQKELTLNVAPPKYDGPYLNPKPFDRWEKDFIDDHKRGPFFEDSKGPSKRTVAPKVEKVRTFAPSASPLDSLMVSAPVPAPSAPRKFQQLGQSICWSAALFGMIALCAIFSLLLNMKSHKGCQMTCQIAMSNTIAFFSAKLLFAGMCLFTAAVFESIGGPQVAFQEMLTEDADSLAFVVSLARAGFLYALVHVVMYAFCFCGYYHERVVSCASGIGAPLLGFALIDACAVRLRFSDCRSDVTVYVLVAVFAILAVAVLLVLHAVCKGAELFSDGDYFFDDSTHPAHAQNHDEQDFLDIGSTCFGMVSGFLVFKVAERFILGEQSIARGPLGVQSYDEIQWLLVVAFICAGSTLVVCSLRLECWSMWRNSLVRGSSCWYIVSPLGLHPRVVDWLEGSCLMSSAWCLFGAASWSFSGGIFQNTLLQSGFTGAPLFAALSISIVVLVLAIAVGYSKGPGGPPLLHHHGNAVRHSFWIFLVALGLLGGIAWATCYIHAARDLALNFPDYSRCVEGALCCALAVFILPLWARTILPQRRLATEVASMDPNGKLGESWETAVSAERGPPSTVTQQSMSGGSAAAAALLERSQQG